MAVNCSPFGPKPQFEIAAGTPAVGNQLFFYVAGSVSTKRNTYTDSTGGVANANPIVLNSLGQPTNEIWFTAGQSYKVVYAPSTDTDPPLSPIWTIDNLVGINDTTVTIDQWVAGPAPTFVSATSFTLAGDQTSTFHVGRRVKTTNSGGTIYSTIKTSVYAVLTTITVVNDVGTIDSGLSAVSYGLLSATNPSTPLLSDTYPVVSGSGDLTKKLRFEVDGFTTNNTRVITPPDANLDLSPTTASLFLATPTAGGAPALRTIVAADLLGAGVAATTQVFTTTGANTWTKPAGLGGIIVEVYGAGGGGGGCSLGANNCSDGGAAGGYSRKVIAAASLGATETATVGAKGAGAAAGNNPGSTGGTSSFGAHCSATGGVGGSGENGNGGLGGVGATGNVNGTGAVGSPPSSYQQASARSGKGGSSPLGGGGRSQSAAVGEAATGKAAGGGGGADNGGAARTGGAGSDGIIIVTEFY